MLVDGELVWFLERGGRSLLSFSDEPELNHAAAAALAELVEDRAGQLDPRRADQRRRGTGS